MSVFWRARQGASQSRGWSRREGSRFWGPAGEGVNEGLPVPGSGDEAVVCLVSNNIFNMHAS